MTLETVFPIASISKTLVDAADRAIVTSGNSRGNPVEFIRRPDGAIGWVRVVGRIARKE